MGSEEEFLKKLWKKRDSEASMDDIIKEPLSEEEAPESSMDELIKEDQVLDILENEDLSDESS